MITEWHVIDEETPPERTLLMVTGPSSYVNREFLTRAYYDEFYHPRYDDEIRWLGVDNDSLSDVGWRPTHWAYSIQLPEVV